MKSGQCQYDTRLVGSDEENICLAANLLIQGHPVALPSETVYGLAGNALDRESVLKIFRAKDRPWFDPLIVHIAFKNLDSWQSLIQSGLADLNSVAPSDIADLRKLVTQYWPGPLTLVLPRSARVINEVTAKLETVALRMPSHPIFQRVLMKLDFPLAAPSANRFGKISPTRADHVFEELNKKIPLILDGGPSEVGVESTILKWAGQGEFHLLRAGKISLKILQQDLQAEVRDLTHKKSRELHQGMESPGQTDKHYSPRKPLKLFNALDLSSTLLQFVSQGMRPGVITMSNVSGFTASDFESISLSAVGSAQEAAHGLYHALRMMDNSENVDMILIESPTNMNGLNHAILDRLERASHP